jgi:hypothetical protein
MEGIEVGSYQVRSPKYDMDVYMASPFGSDAWDLCCKLGLAEKLLTTSPQKTLAQNNQDLTKIDISHASMGS